MKDTKGRYLEKYLARIIDRSCVSVALTQSPHPLCEVSELAGLTLPSHVLPCVRFFVPTLQIYTKFLE